jgi:uncharacterized protein (DUF1800 family)
MRSLRDSLARLLICNLLAPAPVAAAAPAQASEHAARPAYVSTQLQADARIVHALDRFTFGPRQGDVEQVRAMGPGATGLDRWFEQQLHPAAIDETDLNARLARFPAMQWSTRDLLFRIPSNGIVRQAMNGRISVPSNGPLHAVYENAIYRMQARKEDKAQKQTTAQRPAAAAAPAQAGMTMDASQPPAAETQMQADAPDAQAMRMAARMDALDDDQETAAILALPPDQRVPRLIAMQPSEFESFMKSLRPAQRQALVADLAPAQRETVADLENPERLVAGELMAERLTRDIYSNAQLEEVMTDFWLNHFNIYLRKNEQMPYYLVSYERDVIRPHALGKFEDLLEAVAHSPAMMVYLDNAESMGPDSIAAERAKEAAFRRPDAKREKPQGLNENYARELMELHTLGVNGGYTQADVIQVARILTGWTVDQPAMGGDFVFNPNRHEPGTKKVMGKKFKDGEQKEGVALLHMLASSPATAHFISRKLAIRFASDDPPPALVDRMAKAYLSSGGDIPAVLRTLFRSPEFWAASDDRAKVKTPEEFVVSALRASNADVENFEPLINNLRDMGMPLYGCVPPSGYNWDEATWVSTGALVDRMNFALTLAGNRLPGVHVAWSQDAVNEADALPSPEAEETRLEPMLVPGGVSASTRSAALQQFQAQMANAQGAPQDQPMRAARVANRNNRGGAISMEERQDQLLAGLLLGSPEFQRR